MWFLIIKERSDERFVYIYVDVYLPSYVPYNVQAIKKPNIRGPIRHP